MALKATIFKAELNVADLDRQLLPEPSFDPGPSSF